MGSSLLVSHDLIEEMLEPHRIALGTWHDVARNHAYRMLNLGCHFAPPQPYRDERLAIVAALHDLPALLDIASTGSAELGTYVPRATKLASDVVTVAGHPEWADEVRLMIENHHKIRPYRTAGGVLVEATRRADWVDASFGRLRFGLEKSYVDELEAAFPMNEGVRRAMKVIFRYAVRHPRRPLPMMRW